MHRFAFVLLAGLLLGGAAEAQIALRQSDAVEIIIGPLVDATDGVTAETELTISQGDVLLIKCAAAGDCGSSAQKNDPNACTHVAGGRYKCDLDTTDTDTVGVLHVTVSEPGAAPWFASYVVVEEAVYDACCAASAAPLNAAGVRQAVGLASANLDTQLQTIDTNVDDIGSRLTAARAGYLDNLNVGGAVASAADIAGLNDLAASDLRDLVIEDQGGGVSLGCAIAVVLAYVAGDLATSAGTSTYDDPSGTEERISGTVSSPGNRTGSITCPTY